MTGAELRDWRRRLGWTQAQAGQALGLKPTGDGSSCDAIRHYESGRREVPDTVALLTRYVERFGRLAPE